MVIESSSAELQEKYPDTNQELLDRAVQGIQDVIQEVRTLSVEMRPPSLDDFGIVKTVSSLCKEYNTVYPELTINTQFDINETGIPSSLKIIIYRVIQETLSILIRIGEADIVDLKLYRKDRQIALTYSDNTTKLYSTNMPSHADSMTTGAFSIIKERTLLSGGTFSIDRIDEGPIVATVTWSF